MVDPQITLIYSFQFVRLSDQLKAPHQVPLDIVKALMTDTELLKQVGIGRIFLKPIVVKVFSPQPGSLDARGSWSCPQLGSHQRPAGGDRGRQLPQVEHLGRLAHIKHVFNNLNMLPYLRLNIYSKLPHYTPFVTVNGKKVVEADVEATNGVIVIDHYEC